MMKRRIPAVAALFLAAATMSATAPALAQSLAVDLELVFAVDASASVDDREFALQMEGIARAFREPEIHAAITGGPAGRIAVAMVVWADATIPKQTLAWHVVAGPEDAEAFAGAVETFVRRISGGTGIGSGVVASMRAMDRNGIEGARRVVDVSGDGPETPPREELAALLGNARGMAIARGVTVNGLAILNEVPDLDAYYRDQVVVGQTAFVMAAADFNDFADAFRRKLLREIRDDPPVSDRNPGRGPTVVIKRKESR